MACTCRCDADRRSSRTGIPALPFCTARLNAHWKPADYPKEFRHFGDHIRAKRMNLGLTKKALAMWFGVDEESIANWERGRPASKRNHVKIMQLLESGIGGPILDI